MVKGVAGNTRRKPKQEPKADKAAKPPKAANAAKGHNSGELNDEQSQALLYQHIRIIERLENAAAEAKKAVNLAEAALRADGFTKKDVREVQVLRTDAGQKAARREIERQLRIMRWAGMEVGQQAELFPDDRRPAEDKAFAEGKIAGMEGKDMTTPYAPNLPQGQAWMKGWHAGQEANRDLLAKMKEPRKPKAPPPISDEEFENTAPAGSA